MNSDSSFIPPMSALPKEGKKRSEIIRSLVEMNWKGLVAVITFTAPIFWMMVFSKTDERYLQLKDYQRDQAEMKSILMDVRTEQKEQRALIIQGIRDNVKK